jgi:murein DD-endopeptidase MepM/ murein hydrolase activator NlpD
MKLSNLVLIALAMPLLSACSAGQRTFDLQPSRGGTPRDRHALDAARRASGEEIAAWEAAAGRALRSGLHIDASFRERVRLPHDEPHAVAWRFPLQAGQSLRVRIDAPDGDAVFPEIFQALSGDIFRHVYAAPGRSFEYTARVAGDYVFRLQTPLGKGGLFDVTVASEAAVYASAISAAGLMFPVVGRGLNAIGSVWGDPRDGGSRSHEGVDIFAPRGTPVVAVADGRITGVRHTTVGGRVVWLDDPERALSFYYAHLDRQLVRDGQWVRAGDTLGTVGNTGNAVSTPPHLHFGVYRPGTVAVNPTPYLRGMSATRLVAQSRAAASQPVLLGANSDASALGQRLHLAGERVRIRSSPSTSGQVVTELSGLTPMLVLGVVGDWHRVVLEDGTSGFVSARFSGAGQGSMR